MGQSSAHLLCRPRCAGTDCFCQDGAGVCDHEELGVEIPDKAFVDAVPALPPPPGADRSTGVPQAPALMRRRKGQQQQQQQQQTHQQQQQQQQRQPELSEKSKATSFGGPGTPPSPAANAAACCEWGTPGAAVTAVLLRGTGVGLQKSPKLEHQQQQLQREHVQQLLLQQHQSQGLLPMQMHQYTQMAAQFDRQVKQRAVSSTALATTTTTTTTTTATATATRSQSGTPTSHKQGLGFGTIGAGFSDQDLSGLASGDRIAPSNQQAFSSRLPYRSPPSRHRQVGMPSAPQQPGGSANSANSPPLAAAAAASEGHREGSTHTSNRMTTPWCVSNEPRATAAMLAWDGLQHNNHRNKSRSDEVWRERGGQQEEEVPIGIQPRVMSRAPSPNVTPGIACRDL